MQDAKCKTDKNPHNRKDPAVIGRCQKMPDIRIDTRHQDQRAEKQVPEGGHPHSAGLRRRFRIHCHDPAAAAPDPPFLNFHIVQLPMGSVQKHHCSDTEFQQPHGPYDNKHREIPEAESADGSTDQRVCYIKYLRIPAITRHKSFNFRAVRRTLRQMHSEEHPF